MYSKKQIIPLLISHYTKVIDKIVLDQHHYGPDITRAKNIIDYLDVDNGVCFAATRVFDTNVQSTDWIREYASVGAGYWYKIPRDTDSVDEIIECLQYRLDILIKIRDKKVSLFDRILKYIDTNW